MATEMQSEEVEVLRSIYDGDKAFLEVNDTTFQYKYGDDGDNKSFMVEVRWTDSYPDQLPIISMDTFYNKHILPDVKLALVQQVTQQAHAMLGMSMTFTLFEWVKENAEELMVAQTTPAVPEVTAEVEELSIAPQENHAKKEKKETLTKNQKRRAWDRVQGGGVAERSRGWDWVDLIRHLSQTANRL